MSLGILGIVLVLASVLQAAGVLVYRIIVCRGVRRPTPRARRWPRICVFVPVRGGGPQWQEALERVLTLDYPDYEVCVVVDHPTDPAAEVVRSVIENNPGGRLRMMFLGEPAPNRSLLCSGLMKFFDSLDPSCELVAFCGADMHLPRHYFREMAAPMADPSVGTTLGNRWYRPVKGSWGSIVRYLWNVGAVVPMWLAQIPWGGACVLRPEDIRRSGLQDSWKTSMVEDALIRGAMLRLGLKCAFVPKLLIVEDAPIDMNPCHEFINRQILWTRLYHPHWWVVVLHAIFATTLMFIPWVLAIIAAAVGAFQFAGVALLSGVMYWLAQALLVVVLESTARRVTAVNDQPLPPMDFGLYCRIFLAIPLAQFVFAQAVFACMKPKSVRWSGINYEIRGPHKIRLLGYRPVLATGSNKEFVEDYASSPIAVGAAADDSPSVAY